MKKADIEQFVEENGLLKNVPNKSGIYAILIDEYIAYIGQSKNMYRRCCEHIYNTENAMLVKEKKYELLLSAKLGGHKVDCVPLKYVSDIDLLTYYEMKAIGQAMPPLNKLTPSGLVNIDNLKIEELLDKL